MTVSKIESSLCIKLLLCLFFVLGGQAAAYESEASESTLTMPIQANLKILENRLNAEIPGMLADINEPNKICIKAEWLKTKVPYVTWEIRNVFGIKTKIPTTRTKMVKTKVTPDIRCDVKGWVRRNGKISVSGDGSKLRFAFPIKAKISAKAGIRETAHAAAIIYVNVKPQINSDWSISVDAEPDFVWSERPYLKLFGLIKVTIGSKVEPKLRDELNKFVAKVPGILAELNLKEKVASTWSEIQNPIRVSDDPEIYVLFKPDRVAYSGFDVKNNILKTTLSVKGKTKVLFGKPDSSANKTKLSSFGTIPYQDGKFNFPLPVFIPFKEVIRTANAKFPDGYVTELNDGSLKGTLSVSSPKIEKTNDGKLLLSVNVNYDNRKKWLKFIDVFDWFDIDGVLTFTGRPSVHAPTRVLAVDEFEYDSSTNSELFDALVDVAGIKVVRDYLTREVVFAYGPKIDDGLDKANKALNISTKDDVKISASLQKMDIEKVSVNNSDFRIDTKLSGVVNASVGL